MKTILLIIALSSLLGCRNDSGKNISGVDDLRLTDEQIGGLKIQVSEKADADAALRIARHYLYVLRNRDEALKWIRIAESHGSKKASEYRKELNDVTPPK